MDGLRSVLDYLRMDRPDVPGERVPAPDRDTMTAFWKEDDGSKEGVVLSTTCGAVGHVWTTVDFVDEHLSVGPERFASHVPGPLEPMVADDPSGGIHVDFDRQTVSVWDAMTSSEDIEHLAQRSWPGFKLERWYDRFESHNEALGAAIIDPQLDRTTMRSTIQNVAAGPTMNWSNPVANFAAWFRRSGTPVSFTSAVDAHVPVAPGRLSEFALARLAELEDEVLHGTEGMPPPVRVILPSGNLSGDQPGP
ncbi:hypothetical protein EF834_00390 [Rhodococcus spongiicola]|uniref:Uncharacterized protein n=1 Tax=Rhodococcus spongiicola TaxID=2487352 RepID=A0A438B4U8_9NOCA|nr:hypothetical protein EF834_00390 [Rhodococcus spongiicola]